MLRYGSKARVFCAYRANGAAAAASFSGATYRVRRMAISAARKSCVSRLRWRRGVSARRLSACVPVAPLLEVGAPAAAATVQAEWARRLSSTLRARSVTSEYRRSHCCAATTCFDFEPPLASDRSGGSRLVRGAGRGSSDALACGCGCDGRPTSCGNGGTAARSRLAPARSARSISVAMIDASSRGRLKVRVEEPFSCSHSSYDVKRSHGTMAGTGATVVVVVRAGAEMDAARRTIDGRFFIRERASPSVPEPEGLELAPFRSVNELFGARGPRRKLALAALSLLVLRKQKGNGASEFYPENSYF